MILAGCSIMPRPRSAGYRPTIPPRPVLEAEPLIEPCAIGDTKTVCATITAKDYRAIRVWGLELEREARAACLALGLGKAACGVE